MAGVMDADLVIAVPEELIARHILPRLGTDGDLLLKSGRDV